MIVETMPVPDEDDVDLGVAEEPEQVLPEQRVAAVLDVEEVGADQPVEDERRARHHHRGHREEHHERRDHLRPDEDRHAVERHAWRAELEAVVMSETGRPRGDIGERDELRPDIGALAGVYAVRSTV